VVAIALVASACKQEAKPAAVDASAPAASTSAPVAVAPASATADAPSASATAQLPRDAGAADASVARGLPGDAGATACRLVYGPAQQSWRGPAALLAGKDGAELVFNEDGAPRVVRALGGPIDASAKPKPVPASGDVATATAPPCAFGGGQVFCPSKSGDVVRSAKDGSGRKVVGAHRAGYRIDATTLGTHALMTYLASRKTSEGWVSEAWAVVDDDPPVRISEDGAGATAIDVAPRDGAVVAMMVDARRASTQVHARVLRYGSKLELGPDAVVFIGGPGDLHTASVIATPAAGTAYALLPLSKDGSAFGMATVTVEEAPKVDAPVAWSLYANGLDPAPIAATQGHAPMRVARVRPSSADPSAPKVLELGRLETDGTFTSQGLVPTSGAATDLAVDVDAQGALWLFYTDAAGSWLERRVCP